MNEKWKKERNLLECIFQKRVIYTQVNWEWNIRSDIGAFDTLAIPHIYLIIHTNWGQSYFQYFFIPHTTLGQSRFICTLVIPFCHLTKTSNPSHKSYHKNWGISKAYFSSWRVLYTIVIFFLNEVVHTLQD